MPQHQSSAVQRKSISGLRLRGLRCTERAAVTSGSRSAHWDSSWTSRIPDRETGQEEGHVMRSRQKILKV